MGSFGDFLFGSRQDAKHVGNVDTLLPIQKNNLVNLNQILSDQMGQGVDAYGGQINPGTSPLQQQAFDLVTSLVQGQGAYGQGQDALEGLLDDFDSTGTRETWEASVRDPMVQNWERDILPDIQEHFISQNAGSSGAANRAIAQSGADLAADLGASLSDNLYAGEQDHKNRQLQALPQALNFAQTPIDNALMAGEAQRDISGDQLMELFQKWSYEQPYNNPWLSDYLGMGLNTTAFQPIIQGSTAQPGALDSISRLIAAIR